MKINIQSAVLLGALAALGFLVMRTATGAQKIPVSQSEIEAQERAGVYVGSYNSHPNGAPVWT